MPGKVTRLALKNNKVHKVWKVRKSYLFFFLYKFQGFVIPFIVVGEIFKPLKMGCNLFHRVFHISNGKATLLLPLQVVTAKVIDADRR